MKKLNILTYIIFALTLTCFLGGVSIAKAEEPNGKLTGTYAVSSIKTCYWANSNVSTIHLQGEYTFNGDGTGWAEVTALAKSISQPTPPNQKKFDGEFSYNVNDNYFTIYDLDFYIDDTAILVIEDIFQEGWIGRGSQTLVISNTDGNTETVYTPGGPTTRQCGLTGTAIKVSKD